jgi:hypothetical protein
VLRPTCRTRPRARVRLATWTALAWLCLSLAAAAAPAGIPATDHDATVATAWFELHRRLVQETPGFSPPVAARAFGYLGLTLYEAVVAGMPGYQSLAGRLPGLAELPRPAAGEAYAWPEVANAALAHMTRALFVNTRDENRPAIDRLEEELRGADAGTDARTDAGTDAGTVDGGTLARSREYGRLLADAIHGWAEQDGGALGQFTNYREDYVAPVGPGRWVPTPRAAGQPFPALQPFWGENRPFVPGSVTACAPAPPEYSEDPASAFYAEALEVYGAVRGVTPHQREFAQFWSDEGGATATPAGHWTAILTGLIRQQDRSLAFAAEAHAKLGIAMSDAFVACWNTKYEYGLLRPITYIRAFIDPTWNDPTITDPLLTPPFPEYTSGHSVLSAAAAEVLTGLFGDVAIVDDAHVSRGFAPRPFGSFWEAAEEAAWSRLYGGVHFRSAIEAGLAQGRCVAAGVADLPWHGR